MLTLVQNDLFDVGADLCNPIIEDPKYPPLRVTEDYITRLEGWCDEFNARLAKLDSFILPGGTPGRGAAACGAHGLPARRARAWALIEADPDRTNPLAAKYLNRLSDLLFILARLANPDGDVKWVPGGDRYGPESRPPKPGPPKPGPRTPRPPSRRRPERLSSVGAQFSGRPGKQPHWKRPHRNPPRIMITVNRHAATRRMRGSMRP